MNSRALRVSYGVLLVALFGAAVAVGMLERTSLTQTCQPPLSSPSGAVRFIDTRQQSSLSVQTDPHSAEHGTFSYQTDKGANYHGGPMQGLTSADARMEPLACVGLLRVTYSGKAVRTDSATTANGSKSDAKASQVIVQLVAFLDLKRLTGTVQFTDQTNHVMSSTATIAPPNMAQAVSTTSLAATQQNWQALYSMTAQSAVGSFTEEQFAQAMAKQEAAVGTITSITMTSQPQVATDTSGVTFFTVNEHVTMTHDGKQMEFDVVAVYLLEAGKWKLWFTQKE